MKRILYISTLFCALAQVPTYAQNESVGTPKGNFTVSPTGAAVYSIKIDTPQGIGGLQPKIEICYNSQSMEGIVGVGCNILGISCISHAPKDIFHDNAARGVSYDANDALYLDGKRLLLTSGTAYSPGATYTVESDPFTVVTVVSSNSGSGISFHVDTPDGMRSYYGASSNSQLNINSTKTHSWYINRAEDARENYISYHYFQDDNCIYPDYIQYGMIDLDTGINNKITFVYENRTTDIKHFYIGNVSGSVTKRLKEIRTTTGSNVFRKYVLTYDDQTDGHSRLVSVVEKNGANESLRPITMSWNYLQRDSIIPVQPSIQLEQSSSYLSFDERNFLAMDMNGDGIDDIVQISPIERIQGTTHTHYSGAFVHFSRYENGSIRYETPVCLYFPPSYTDNGWIMANMGMTGVDFDGDGLSDLMIPATQIIEEWGMNYFKIELALGKDISSNNLVGGEYAHSLYNTSGVPRWVSADFNNDGRTEVLYIEYGKYSGSYRSCFIYNPNSTGEMQLSTIETSLSLDNNPESIQQGDFNGDGLIDIIVFYEDGYRVFFNNGNGANAYPFSMSNSHYGTNITYAPRIYPGDFNGDAVADLFVNENITSNCYFAFGHNDGTFTKSVACALDGTLIDKNTAKDDERFTILVTDFNNDGRSDVLIGKSGYEYHGGLFGNYYSYLRTTYCWMQSTGAALSEVQRYTIEQDEDGPRPSHFLLGNFSGVGKPEILGYGRDITGTDPSTVEKLRIYRCGLTPSDDKLVSVTDGMGNHTNINYATITDTLVYTKGTGSSYPMVDCQIPFHVVSSTTASRGTLVDEQIRYKYGGLKLHQQGKGLLGFSTTIADNLTTGLKQTQTLAHWDDDYYLPLLATTILTQAGTTTSTVHKSSLVEYPGNNFKVYNDTIQQFDIFGNETLQTFESDTDHGYLLTQKTTDVPTGSYKQLGYSGYQYKGRTYLPTLVTLTQKHPDDQNTFVDKTQYTYTTTGLASSVKEHADTPKALTHTYTYDFIGNKLTEAVSGIGVTTQTTTYTYNTYRFVSRAQTLPATTDIRYTYDTFGNRLTMSDHTYGTTLTTQYEYDNWGNLVNTISPEGVNTDITRGWSSGSGYYEQVETGGAPSVITHYDSYGHKIHEGSVGPDGISLSTAWSYNSKGLVTSEIKTTGSLQETHTYSYDDLGRMVGEVLPTGQTNTYSYGNRSRTSVTAGRTYTSTFDAWGNIKSSVDPVSSVTYEYYSNGQPNNIVSGGDVWHLEYDEAGNRTLLDDPDAGVTEYLYDALGRLIEQEDARGYVTINTYDDKGHLTSTETDGAVTTYNYGTIGNSKMRLIQVQDANGFISYTYDSVGRVKTKVRNLTGTGTYSSTEYSYNSLNQLVSRTCNGQIEQYYYDSNGYKCRSTINGQDVWELQDYNGIRTVASLGDSLTSISERNLFGVNHLAVVHGNDTISNFRYEYSNATGNVTSRTGMLTSKESFGYDSVDRLTSAYSPGGTLLNMVYADNGNITMKTRLGFYSHSGDQPHAVTGIMMSPPDYGNTSQVMTYDAYNKVGAIRQGRMLYSITYGPDRERWRTAYLNINNTSRTILYGDDYERITVGDTVRHFYYLDGGAIYLMESGKPDRLLFTCTDNLGSIVKVVNKSGTPVFKATYDVWGYQNVTKNQIGFHRGFTGHEMLPEFCLINMNGRMYDPVVGRFLSPDNYIQFEDFSQSYNRYSYCLNNPLKYTDPDGESAILIGFIVGAVAGAYMGGVLANDSYNPFDWHRHSATTWRYMLYGALVGGISGAIGGSIAASGMPFANTTSVAFSSFYNSVGTSLYTNGKVPVSISLGVASWNLTNNEWGVLGKKGNDVLDNISYGLGALANFSDILLGLHPQEVDLVTEHSDGLGHSSIVETNTWTGIPNHFDPNGLISVGPAEIKDSFFWANGINHWDTHSRLGEIIWRQSIFTNRSTINRYSEWLNYLDYSEKLKYSLVFSSCVTHTSMALNLSGVFNLGIHPYLLHAQIYLWNNGIRPWVFCNYLNNLN